MPAWIADSTSLIDGVDVLPIVDPFWVVVNVNRFQQLGTDLRRERKVRRDRLDRQAEGEAEHDRQLRTAKLLLQPGDTIEPVRNPAALG